MNRSVRAKKIARLKTQHQLQVIDLFAGCGGLSLGFQAAGFNILGAVEKDPTAAKTHAHNFHKGQEELHGSPRDITAVNARAFLEELYPQKKPELLVDVLAGGPPCQAYARVGRAKLRKVSAHPEAFKVDERGKLYTEYLKWVDDLQPLAVVMENVPDALNYGGVNIAHEVCVALSSKGYRCRYTLLNAVHYGVPQTRQRLFIIALAEELDVEPTFPKATTLYDLPTGYISAKSVALKGIVPESDDYYCIPPSCRSNPDLAITARQAIEDLKSLQGNDRRGAKRFVQLEHYRSDVAPSEYARLMRGGWPPFGNAEDGVRDHVIRSLPRDYPIFAKMEEGDEYPSAYKAANELFEDEARVRGYVPGTAEYEELKGQMVPPYDPKKFPNKWRKLEGNKPARTLMAHLGKDSYSHIHYEQARTISVREAARLQSFPDGFIFRGAMNAAFRQIGNAVPPLMAKALATHVREMMEKAACRLAR